MQTNTTRNHTHILPP